MHANITYQFSDFNRRWSIMQSRDAALCVITEISIYIPGI